MQLKIKEVVEGLNDISSKIEKQYHDGVIDGFSDVSVSQLFSQRPFPTLGAQCPANLLFPYFSKSARSENELDLLYGIARSRPCFTGGSIFETGRGKHLFDVLFRQKTPSHKFQPHAVIV